MDYTNHLISVAATAIVRMVCIDDAINSDDPTLQCVNANICTEILLHYSLMAATIPCLKPFVIAFNTRWGQGQGMGSSYVIEDMSATGGKYSSKQSKKHSFINPTFRVDKAAHLSNASHDPEAESAGDGVNSIGSHESQRMIIRETRAWMVEHESYEMDDYNSDHRGRPRTAASSSAT